MFALALLTACSASERVAIELPLVGPGLVARAHAGRTEAWAVDPAQPSSLAPPIAAWDGDAPIRLAAAELDLTRLELALGSLPAAPASSRTLAERAPPLRAAFVRELSGDDDTGWQAAPTLPALLGTLALPADSPCAGARVRVVTPSLEDYSFTTVAIIPARDGIPRAIIGSDTRGGPTAQGGVGVVTSTDTEPGTHPLEPTDLSPRHFRWDGAQTVWGAILESEPTTQRVVQLDLGGRVRASLHLPRTEEHDVLRFALTPDRRVIGYSLSQVVELTAGATTTVARDADYPRRLVSLVEASPTLRIAIDADGAVFGVRDGAWVEETHALPGVVRAYAVEGRAYAMSREELFVRADDGTWSKLDEPFPTINKQSIAPWLPGSFALSGGAGLLAAYRPSYGWCTMTVPGTRQLRELDVLDGRAVAFEYNDDTGTRGSTVLYWIDLPGA